MQCAFRVGLFDHFAHGPTWNNSTLHRAFRSPAADLLSCLTNYANVYAEPFRRGRKESPSQPFNVHHKNGRKAQNSTSAFRHSAGMLGTEAREDDAPDPLLLLRFVAAVMVVVTLSADDLDGQKAELRVWGECAAFSTVRS